MQLHNIHMYNHFTEAKRLVKNLMNESKIETTTLSNFIMSFVHYLNLKVGIFQNDIHDDGVGHHETQIRTASEILFLR